MKYYVRVAVVKIGSADVILPRSIAMSVTARIVAKIQKTAPARNKKRAG
jgi:glucose uptake protein GlcU